LDKAPVFGGAMCSLVAGCGAGVDKPLDRGRADLVVRHRGHNVGGRPVLLTTVNKTTTKYHTYVCCLAVSRFAVDPLPYILP